MLTAQGEGPRAGDFMRTASALVEQAMATTPAGRVAANGSCEMERVAVWLAGVLAHCAEAAGEDLSPMIGRWRRTARQLDVAAGESPSPN